MKKPAKAIKVGFLFLAIALVSFGCLAKEEAGDKGMGAVESSWEKAPETGGFGQGQYPYYPSEGQGMPQNPGQNYSSEPEIQAKEGPQAGEEGREFANGSQNQGGQTGGGNEQDGRYSMYNYGCEGSGPVNFTYPPRKVEDIGFIEPMGEMLGNHVTPIDHQYYYPSVWTQELDESKFKDVYAPAGGIITSLESMPAYFSQAKGADIGDYRIIMHHTCTFYSIYIHVNQLSSRLEAEVGGKGRLEKTVKIEAGELIGRARSFDFSVHNEEVQLEGFIFPEHYRGEVWKVHTVDPFDYFVPEVREALLSKNLRAEEPLGGKIDWDVPGTLAGSWFMEGTNWYEGIKRPEYWETHASFSPNAIDPDHFMVSLGNYSGEAKQFGARGNSPKPEEVSVSTGLVKYELVDFDFLDESGKYWNRVSYAKGIKVVEGNDVKGTVLVRLLEEGKLKLEAFPGKSAGAVFGFTKNAKIYER